MKNNLIKRIGKCSIILAAGTLIGSGICYAKETNHQGYEIPDLSETTLVGTRYDDLTDRIEGPETRVDIYEKGRIQKVSIDDKVFLYGVSNHETGEVYAIADLDGDGIFETKYDIDDLTFTEEGTDDQLPDFPAKKDLPPEWVLK